MKTPMHPPGYFWHFLAAALRLGLAVFAGCFALAGLARGDNVDPRLSEQPTAPYTADQILNGDTPGRKASPAVADVYDESGFAKERLYHVPKSGVHPRILFGPEDLPRIREQLHGTAAGKRILATLKGRIAATIDKPGTGDHEAYEALLTGEPKKYKEALIRAGWNPKAPPGAMGNSVLNGLLYKLILSTVENDPASARDAAKAAATAAAIAEADIDEANKLPFSEDYWRVIRNCLTFDATYGFLYDMGQPFMTPEQAAGFHRMLVKATKGKYTLGMDLPHHWRNWNFMGMAEYFPVMALAIEGEEGYDARIFERGKEVARDYLNYSMTLNGIAKEAVGYHSGGTGHTTVLMLAAANRGENLLTNKRYRQFAENWCLWAMQPWGGFWESSGDLGTFPPNYTLLQAMAFFYPKSAKIDFILQNHPFVRDETMKLDLLSTVLAIATPADPKKGPDGKLVNYDFGKVFGMPNSLFEPERGYSFARTGWDKDAATLQFVCRNDTRFPSHDFPDRGAFYFSANGRAWSVPGMRENEPKFLNTITIDGRGQGYFPTPGQWLERIETQEATFNAVDVSYCYSWRWSKSPFVMTDDEFKAHPWLAQYEEARQRQLSRTPLKMWELEPSPAVVDYYSGYLAGDPRMWDEDSWVKRAPHFPVKKAFRIAGLVRGAHPYAMIVDDIQKDDQERLYEWRMSMPNDVEAVEIKANEIVLAPISEKRAKLSNPMAAYQNVGRPLPAPGTPMLLVHVVNANQPDIPTFTPNLSLETIEMIKTDDTHQFTGRDMGMAKRLVIPSRSAAPDYKIVLVPFRQGEALPEFAWDKEKGVLAIKWKDQADECRFTPAANGRTLLAISRDGNEIVAVKGEDALLAPEALKAK